MAPPPPSTPHRFLPPQAISNSSKRTSSPAVRPPILPIPPPPSSTPSSQFQSAPRFTLPSSPLPQSPPLPPPSSQRFHSLVRPPRCSPVALDDLVSSPPCASSDNKGDGPIMPSTELAGADEADETASTDSELELLTSHRGVKRRRLSPLPAASDSASASVSPSPSPSVANDTLARPRPRFLLPAATAPPDDTVSASAARLFSPSHRKGGRAYVHGGLADTVRAWVVQRLTSGVGTVGLKRERDAASSTDELSVANEAGTMMKVRVSDWRRGGGVVLVSGTLDGGERNLLLLGDEGSRRGGAVDMEEGGVVELRGGKGMVWEVETEGGMVGGRESWLVAADWRCLPAS